MYHEDAMIYVVALAAVVIDMAIDNANATIARARAPTLTRAYARTRAAAAAPTLTATRMLQLMPTQTRIRTHDANEFEQCEHLCATEFEFDRTDPEFEARNYKLDTSVHVHACTTLAIDRSLKPRSSGESEYVPATRARCTGN